MHLTRMHVLLICVLTSIIFIFILHNINKTSKKIKEEEKLIEVEKEPSIDENQIKKEYEEKIRETAKKTIAIAGEYWKIARKEGRDYYRGQLKLREAKDKFTMGEYERAIEIAKEAINELKSAPPVFLKTTEKAKRTYVVKRDDCLWNIAKMEKHYGKGSMWVKIWRANEKKIPDFDLIRPGLRLEIP